MHIARIALVALFVAATAGESFAQRAGETSPTLDAILSTRRSGTLYNTLPSKTLRDLDVAYRFQRQLARREQRRLGPVVGYKVGYASKAAQEQFGVDSPARGPLFLSQLIASGSTRLASEFREMMLETEVAFVLSKPIGKGKAPKSMDELRRRVRSVHAALDASDYAFKSDAKPTPIDMVATGLGAHRFVLGPGVDPKGIEVKSIELKLVRNAEEIRSSPATEVMGSPWNSLMWCVEDVLGRGGHLPAGAIIITGTADKAWKVTGDQIQGHYVGDCGLLGRVEMTLK